MVVTTTTFLQLSGGCSMNVRNSSSVRSGRKLGWKRQVGLGVMRKESEKRHSLERQIVFVI